MKIKIDAVQHCHGFKAILLLFAHECKFYIPKSPHVWKKLGEVWGCGFEQSHLTIVLGRESTFTPVKNSPQIVQWKHCSALTKQWG